MFTFETEPRLNDRDAGWICLGAVTTQLLYCAATTVAGSDPLKIENLLQAAQGGSAFANLASSFGVNPSQASIAISTILEDLARRIERNTLSRSGVADMVALLDRPAAGRALLDPQRLAAPDTISAGDHVLNILIGNKDTSRAIAQRAARASGLDETVLKKLLPVVASMMIGGLQKETLGNLARRLQSVPGLGISAGGSPLSLPGDDDVPDERNNNRPQQNSPDDRDWHGGLPRTNGGGGAGAGGTSGGSPLPIPGDDIPDIDSDRGGQGQRFPNLPDIVRRGGTQVPGPSGGSLEQVIRSILGSLLGFQGGGGIMSWLIKLFFARWFWGFIRRILSRVALGR